MIFMYFILLRYFFISLGSAVLTCRPLELGAYIDTGHHFLIFNVVEGVIKCSETMYSIERVVPHERALCETTAVPRCVSWGLLHTCLSCKSSRDIVATSSHTMALNHTVMKNGGFIAEMISDERSLSLGSGWPHHDLLVAHWDRAD